MHIHNAIRYEMRSLVEALEVVQARGTKLAEWEVKMINKAWKAHEEHVHSHHSNEDDILIPQLKERFNYPEQVCFLFRNWLANGNAIFVSHSVLITFFCRNFFFARLKPIT